MNKNFVKFLCLATLFHSCSSILGLCDSEIKSLYLSLRNNQFVPVQTKGESTHRLFYRSTRTIGLLRREATELDWVGYFTGVQFVNLRLGQIPSMMPALQAAIKDLETRASGYFHEQSVKLQIDTDGLKINPQSTERYSLKVFTTAKGTSFQKCYYFLQRATTDTGGETVLDHLYVWNPDSKAWDKFYKVETLQGEEPTAECNAQLQRALAHFGDPQAALTAALVEHPDLLGTPTGEPDARPGFTPVDPVPGMSTAKKIGVGLVVGALLAALSGSIIGLGVWISKRRDLQRRKNAAFKRPIKTAVIVNAN